MNTTTLIATTTAAVLGAPSVQIRDYDMKGGQLLRASHQWATRPADERFDSLDAALAATRAHRRASRSAKAALGTLRAEAHDGDVMLVGKSGVAAGFTHHAFGQLCSTVKAPAAYLRRLSAQVAATCLNEGLAAAATDDTDDSDDSDKSLLFRADADAGGMSLHALVSDKYRRVWNHEVLETLVALREAAPQWTFPIAHRSAARVSGTGAGTASWGTDSGRELPVCYASDHDMFVFLTDQQNTIEVAGTRYFRGFFVENSEVGAASFRVTMFLFDSVCCNVIVWGVTQVREITMRHVGSIREAVLGPASAVRAALASYTNRPASEDQARIATAMRTLVADTREATITTLLGRRISGLTETALDAAYTIVEQTPRYGDPRSVWGIVNGLTEYSQRGDHADARIALDRAAGKVLEIAF